jgi:hypothetical protein
VEEEQYVRHTDRHWLHKLHAAGEKNKSTAKEANLLRDNCILKIILPSATLHE